MLGHAIPASGEVGAEMGRNIGEYTVQNHLTPAANLTAR
jgi:hypothetical protein